MDGKFPSLMHSRFDTREEALKEADRLNQIREKNNEEARDFIYKERGDAFRKPSFNDDVWSVKEIQVNK